MPANTAMSRLHRILAHRKGMLFVFKPVSQTFDLRKATNRFRITQVDFEVLPVNPHTGDLGQQLGESKKLDHIQKLKGKAEAKPNDALKLAGGFLTAIQELQQSGHCRVASLEVQVNKPRRPRELSEDPEEETWGDEADVRVVLRGRRLEYPFLRITSWRCFNSQRSLSIQMSTERDPPPPSFPEALARAITLSARKRAMAVLSALAVVGGFLGSASVSISGQMQRMISEYPFSDYLRRIDLFDHFLFWPQFTLLTRIVNIALSGMLSICIIILQLDNLAILFIMIAFSFMLYTFSKTWGLIDLVRIVTWHYEDYKYSFETFTDKGT